MTLAPQACVGDGKLDLVLITVAERSALATHLARLREGKSSTPRFPSRTVRQVVISSNERRHHLDGKFHENPETKPRDHVEAVIEPHALQILVPPAA